MEETKAKQDHFTDKEINNFTCLFHVLARIHKRLIQQGYTIKNGEIIPPKAE